MKIQYLKPAPNATTGDIKDINTAQAKILIQLGFAKEYDETDSDNGNTGDLFGQLDDNQNPDQEPSETETTEPTADDQEPSKADEVSEQVQEVAETAPAGPATPTETAKPKKTKKTNTESN